MLCENCKAAIPTIKTKQALVNEALSKLGFNYYESISATLLLIDAALRAHGFQETEDTVEFSGLDAKLDQEVGEGKWVHIRWHRMPSGRYEVVAYVN